MIKWNEVTWYSRWGSILLFILVVPCLSFYIGTQYANVSNQLSTPETHPTNAVSTAPLSIESLVRSYKTTTPTHQSVTVDVYVCNQSADTCFGQDTSNTKTQDVITVFDAPTRDGAIRLGFAVGAPAPSYYDVQVNFDACKSPTECPITSADYKAANAFFRGEIFAGRVPTTFK